jgi:hypothetical protein
MPKAAGRQHFIAGFCRLNGEEARFAYSFFRSEGLIHLVCHLPTPWSEFFAAEQTLNWG